MSLLRVATRRVTPVVARAGRQQARWSSTTPHYDPFSLDPNNKRQTFFYYTALFGALAAPAFAVRYQLNKYKADKRSFG